MTQRTERLARNEAAFRMLNERARAVTEELALEGIAPEPGRLECVCECSDPECTARLVVRAEDYELARSDAARFLVAAGHVNPEIEREVLDVEGAVVVEKHPGERAVAAATDPRA
jgi:hypothetical protein